MAGLTGISKHLGHRAEEGRNLMGTKESGIVMQG